MDYDNFYCNKHCGKNTLCFVRKILRCTFYAPPVQMEKGKKKKKETRKRNNKIK
jgi:hypothetical protein